MIQRLYHIGILTLLALVGLTSCQSHSDPTLKVAATSVPHAEILEEIKPDLQEKGLNLAIIVVEDYQVPNRALNDLEVDANFFQHRPFLEEQMKDFGYRLESIATVHIEPMALYSKRISQLNELKSSSTVAVPSDPTNQARALCLLQESGLITLARCDSKTSLLDIEKNQRRLRFVEIDSPLLTRVLDDVDLAAITTNFALQAGLSPKEDALATEGAQSIFANILVIREGEGDRSDLKSLKNALTSDKVKELIKERYKGAVMPAF